METNSIVKVLRTGTIVQHVYSKKFFAICTQCRTSLLADMFSTEQEAVDSFADHTLVCPQDR